MKAVWIATVFAATGLAQQGIVSGYVFDASREGFRAVLGLPGGASLGDVRTFAGGISTAEVRGSIATFISEEDRPQLYRVRLDSAQEPAAIHTALQRPSRILLNRNGSTALVYSREERLLQFVDEASPSSGPLPESLLNGELRTAAISAEGECALIATADAIHTLCASGRQVRLLDEIAPVDVAWTPDGRGALVLEAGRLLRVRDVDSLSAPETLVSLEGGLRNAVALLALDAHTVAVASASDPSLLLVDLRQIELPRVVALPATPTVLNSLTSPSLLTCTQAGREPLLLLDGKRGWTPFFVPLD